MTKFVDFANRVVWGAPALILILGVGLFLSLYTGFPQLTLFPKACKIFLSKLRISRSSTGVSPFQALCTALAATIGTGNIVGVAGAIALGGPGAVFWMWLSAILGMMTKFAEATLAVHYRQKKGGEWAGGPMYMISCALHKRWHFLAYLYCFFGVFAAFGVGNATQINAVVTGVSRIAAGFGVEMSLRRNLGLGLLLAVLIGSMLLGGAKRIAAAAQVLVPVAACAYLVLGFGVLILRADAIPGAFAAIFQGAFSPRAFTGGMVGSFFRALRVGVSRGVFTNEAGMGTASIAHACAEVERPAEQGLMGIMEVFLDTIVICTMTALVILCSGIPIPYGQDVGAALTSDALCAVYGSWASVFLTAALSAFAIATVLGWGFYGIRCAEFLFGISCRKGFALMQTAMVALSAVLETGVIWSLAELINGLMAIPNLIALVFLSPKLRKLTVQYKLYCGGKTACGGTYENFYQCKSLPAFPHAKVPSLCGGSETAGKKDLSSEHRPARSAHTSDLFRRSKGI